MLGVLLLVVLFGVAIAPVHAQAPFAGRTVTIVVGYPTGGGYDRAARMVGR